MLTYLVAFDLIRCSDKFNQILTCASDTKASRWTQYTIF